MNNMHILTISILALGLGAVGCSANADEATGTENAALTRGPGFGDDMLFGNLISSPDLIAIAACPDFGIAAGDRLMALVDQSTFQIIHEDPSSFPDNRNVAFEIQIPTQGNYVWDGPPPNRITNQIISPALGLEAFMDSRTYGITLAKRNPKSECVLTRCPGYGSCP